MMKRGVVLFSLILMLGIGFLVGRDVAPSRVFSATPERSITLVVKAIEQDYRLDFPSESAVGSWKRKQPTDSHAYTQWNTSYWYDEQYWLFLNWEYLKNGQFHLGTGGNGLGTEFQVTDLAFFLDSVEVHLLDRDNTGYFWLEMSPSGAIAEEPEVSVKDRKGKILFQEKSPFRMSKDYGWKIRPTASHAVFQHSAVTGSTSGCYLFINWEWLRSGNFHIGVGGTCLDPKTGEFTSVQNLVDVYIDSYQVQVTDPTGDGYFLAEESPFVDGVPKFSERPRIRLVERQTGLEIFNLLSPFQFYFTK